MSPLSLIFLSASTLFAYAAAYQPGEWGAHGSSGSFQVIDMMVVVDTEALYDYYRDKPRSMNHLSPTPISRDFSYMIASYDYVVDHQASADLHIKANVGDTLRLYGVSETGNEHHAVIVYNITSFAGDQVISTALLATVQKDSVRPIKGKFPEVEFPDQLFWPVQLTVSSKGESQYKVRFAMYSRDTDSSNQKIFGYFEWEPTLTVPV